MTEGERWLHELEAALIPWGLNHVGVVSGQAWDAVARPETTTSALAPGARSVVVVASAGPALWEAFVGACRADPQHLLSTPHPLDQFCRRAVHAATAGQEHAWFHASFDAPIPLDFRTLAVLAGLGAPSRLGLVLDAEWGPWMGLRAAAFVPFSLPLSPPAPDLCADCSAPCEVACPGDAFVQGRWSVARCANFHQVSVACAASCAARSACPVGSVHRYSDLELLYHYNRAQGRVALRAALGIPAEQDPHMGSGPYWGAWSG